MGDGGIVTRGGERDELDPFAEDIKTGDEEIMPEDVIFEILLLLPVISLIRFKCVSKAWMKLISSSDFARLHYSKSCKRRAASDGYLVDIMVTVKQYDEELLHPYRLTLNTKTVSKHSELGLQPVYQPPHIRRLHCYHGNGSRNHREILLGPCWGLYCKFSGYGNKFALWNPATREAHVVPLPSAPRFSIHLYPVGCGFGACIKNDGNPYDFKFVRVIQNTLVPKKFLEVYSLRNKCWHSLETSVGPGCDSTYQGSVGVELNQVVHWFMGNEASSGHTFIFTFNLGDETCGTIELPIQIVRNCLLAQSYSLSTLDNQYLSLTVVSQVMHSDYVDIWILGQHAAWTKYRRVELKGQVPRVCGYWNNIERGVVIGQDDWVEGSGYLSTDFKTGENLVLFIDDDVQLKLPLKEIGRLMRFNYAESLVSLSWPS